MTAVPLLIAEQKPFAGKTIVIDTVFTAANMTAENYVQDTIIHHVPVCQSPRMSAMYVRTAENVRLTEHITLPSRQMLCQNVDIQNRAAKYRSVSVLPILIIQLTSPENGYVAKMRKNYFALSRKLQKSRKIHRFGMPEQSLS